MGFLGVSRPLKEIIMRHLAAYLRGYIVHLFPICHHCFTDSTYLYVYLHVYISYLSTQDFPCCTYDHWPSVYKIFENGYQDLRFHIFDWQKQFREPFYQSTYAKCKVTHSFPFLITFKPLIMSEKSQFNKEGTRLKIYSSFGYNWEI